MTDIKRPFAADALPWEPWSHGERFGGRVKHLGRHAGGTHVGVNLEELPPGKQSCPLHYHMLEEEHLYVLEGRPTLRLGAERIVLAPGDYVCFPAGQESGHALVNETDAPCRYLVIGERDPHDVIVYPDSGKVMVRAARRILRGDATVDYWEGE
jgi:uncharacterized cupin superfamily protein